MTGVQTCALPIFDEIVNQFPHEDQFRYYIEGEPVRARDKFMAQKPDYLDQLLSDFEPDI